jgi:hypothetical protein
MVNDLATRTGKVLSQETASTIIAVTGGYAGLLRSAFTLLDPGVLITPTEEHLQSAATYLTQRLPIRTECRTIWMSLTPSEQFILRAVARITSYDINVDTEIAINQLIQKRLLRLDKATNQLHINPPVFRAYILSNKDES